jgi:hypothetical protein
MLKVKKHFFFTDLFLSDFIFLTVAAGLGVVYSVFFFFADLGDNDFINSMKLSSGVIGIIASYAMLLAIT